MNFSCSRFYKQTQTVLHGLHGQLLTYIKTYWFRLGLVGCSHLSIEKLRPARRPPDRGEAARGPWAAIREVRAVLYAVLGRERTMFASGRRPTSGRTETQRSATPHPLRES